jgi:hypothetical protein
VNAIWQHTGDVQKPIIFLILLLSCITPSLRAQSLGSAGTITGTVTDPSGAVLPGAVVGIRNPITGYSQATTTDQQGRFRLTNLPPNPYHLEASAPGFATGVQDVSVRTSVPIDLNVKLTLAGAETTVMVNATDLIENVPYAHNDVDQSALSHLPTFSPGSGLSDAITFSTPGVVADSNGFFHPLGDHAQTSYVIDGQPINDQQSKAFSTQLPPNAIQSMELVTGMPNAEFGDKTSLVVNAVTRSGLGQRFFGDVAAYYGSFGSVGERASVGFGGAKWGNFLAANVERSGRFLDSPEFFPMHDIGNNTTIFDRFDWNPTAKDALHLNLFGARNWFQVPITYDQPGQDQRQRVLSFDIAPGYQHTFNSQTLWTVNPWVRKDQVNYYPSADVNLDTPATLSQNRSLMNYGIRTDVNYVHGIHNIKVGAELMQTRLHEAFGFGITDPTFNPVCLNGDAPVLNPGFTNPDACASVGFTANPNLLPGLVAFDLTRGGSLFTFNDRGNINQFAAYVQDQITLGNLSISAGIRFDKYHGLSAENAAEPRAGVSYLMKKTGTVLRASYARTFETPYNENLLLSSASGIGGLATNVFGAFEAAPLKAGRRNQFNTGIQQAIGRWLQVDGDYFWKYTNNAYDFDVLFNTPVTFPISWKKSKIDGVGVRISTTNIHGFQAYTTMGHTRARFFGPENGGLVFNSPVDASVFRIDHDQAFQQTTNLRYQHGKNGLWFDFTWRYDSGLVAGAVTSVQDALALTAAQQTAIGFFCGGQQATLLTPITSCDPATQNSGAVRLKIPKEGTGNDDTNPPRIAPHHIFNVGIGTDNLLRSEKNRVTLRFTVMNIANEVALYNFLSTFSGTHFIGPRSFTAQMGYVF